MPFGRSNAEGVIGLDDPAEHEILVVKEPC